MKTLKIYLFLTFIISLGNLIAQNKTLKSSTEQSSNMQVAQKMFAAFNAHNWVKMSEFYTDNAEYLDPSYGLEYVKKSRTEVVKKYSQMQAVIPDIHDEVLALYPFENKVIVEFISSGTLPDGQKFKLPICTVLTFQNGQIVKDATYYDNN
jgi:ketosteroid isomerase-like protein